MACKLTNMIMDENDEPLYKSNRVIIRRLARNDCEEFVSLVRSSEKFLHPWVVLPDTAAKFGDYLKRFDGVAAEALLICTCEYGNIVGAASISNILREPYQRGVLGYNSFASTARQGYMFEGLRLIIRFAFADLGLHRLEADIQPENNPSLKLAHRLGLRREGFSPEYIHIQGVWKDHERWAMTCDMLGTCKTSN